MVLNDLDLLKLKSNRRMLPEVSMGKDSNLGSG